MLSPQSLVVLRALAASDAVECDGVVFPAGELTVHELVRRLRRRGVSLSVARASLSRTLRRLWRDGLVELSDSWGTTMTERRRARDRWIAAKGDDQDAAYEDYKALVGDDFDRCGSAAAYMVMLRKRPVDLRVTRARITAAGRRSVNSDGAAELTDRRFCA